MSENDDRPRLMTKQQAAAYCGVSGPTFTKWVLAGDMPGPFRSTRMYDRRVIDLVLDKAAGILQGAPPKEDAFDRWKREEAEKAAAAASMTPYQAALAASEETSHEKWYRESQARKARKAERARAREKQEAEAEKVAPSRQNRTPKP
ncbi:hypothetical protein [Bosea sp. WAO]|uniref:helix-turn-helix transcriptional regulator n=1 Tax=Bosea sp. WAO TaxID=406341 RepID=UPI000833A08A|nr:hypothetical protein [Bosea sp. WAO]